MGLLNDHVVVWWWLWGPAGVCVLAECGKGGVGGGQGTQTSLYTCLMEYPSFHRAKCPSHVVPGLWGSEVAVALLKGVSCFRCGQRQRATHTARASLTPNGFRNQMCVVTILCVSPSYFNTKFTMCCEIHTGRRALLGWREWFLTCIRWQRSYTE